MLATFFLLHGRFTLRWRMGARTARLIAGCASKFASNIRLLRDGKSAKAKSRISLLMLGSMDPGTSVDVEVFGPDAYEALQEFTQLFTCGPVQHRCPHQDCDSTPTLVGYGGGRVLYACTGSEQHSWEVIEESSALTITDLESDLSSAPCIHLN